MLRRLSAEASSVLVLDGYAEGYLIKQGGRIKTWHKRYFVFHEGCLSYRKDRRDGAKVLRRDGITDVYYHDKVRNGLCVMLQCGRALIVSAGTEDQANAWYDVLREFLDKRNKAIELHQLHKRQNMHLDPIEECDDVSICGVDEAIAVLSDSDSDTDMWVYDLY